MTLIINHPRILFQTVGELSESGFTGLKEQDFDLPGGEFVIRNSQFVIDYS